LECGDCDSRGLTLLELAFVGHLELFILNCAFGGWRTESKEVLRETLRGCLVLIFFIYGVMISG
jgi:hypothetical protein